MTRHTASTWVTLFGLCVAAACDSAAPSSAPGSFGGSASGNLPAGAIASDSDQGIGLKPGGAQDIAFFRQKVTNKQLPVAADLTLEGWLNEHDTPLPPAAKDRLVTLHALAGVLQDPAGATDAVLQLGLNSAKTLDDVTASLALTLVIDHSGSMSGSKMSDVKAGLHVLANKLPKGTRLAIVKFDDNVTTIFPPQVVGPGEVAKVHTAIEGIVPSGATNLHGGLAAGLQHCKDAPAGVYEVRRILFLSDGQASAGNTSPTAIVGLAQEAAQAGCSVSTVGVGADFDLPLMTQMAQVGNGTAWFVQNADHAKAVFIQDLETMLLPVAEKLWLEFNLAVGWTVKDIPGFDWATEAGKVVVKGPKAATGVPPDPGESNAGKVALPTLFASKRNGFVMVHLAAPQDLAAGQMTGLLLATVHYGYGVAKTGAKEVHEVAVQVPGLVAVPDEGYTYFANPIVRRAWLLLRTGQDLMTACARAEAGKGDEAKAVLTSAVARIDAHVKNAGADLALVDTSQPDLADARALLIAVQGLVP